MQRAAKGVLHVRRDHEMPFSGQHAQRPCAAVVGDQQGQRRVPGFDQLSGSRACLLITARRQHWPGDLSLVPLPLDVFTEPESRAFLRQYQGPTPTPTGFTVCATVTPEPGLCLCHADLYNCADFLTQADLPSRVLGISATLRQTCFDHCWALGRGDIHRLDYDNDLIACESLPDGDGGDK